MTRHYDLEEPDRYHQIKFVEFLDFLGRVAIDYFDEVPSGPKDLEDKVYEIVKLLWAAKAPGGGKDAGAAKKAAKRARGKREKKVQKFPELLAPLFEDSDEY